MNPENELAILEFYEVNNANLYVSSWGGLITSFVTIVSFVQEKRGVSATVRPSTWGGLCITSFLVMISASRLYQNFDCKDRKDWGGWDESAGDEGDFVDMLDAICHRTQFAIGAGVISGVIAAVWLLIQLCAPGFRAVILEIIISVLMFIAWCFGVGFVTFGNNDRAPGADFGNLYFSTWGALVFCGMLVYGAIKRTGSSSDDGIVAPRMEGGNPVENESNDKRNAYENEYRA